MRRGITIMMAALVLAGSVGSAAYQACPSEDANRDARVDVRDLQTALDGALHTGQGDSADVNADGTVNVLDLQQMLAKAGAEDAETQHEPANTDGTAPATVRVPAPVFALASVTPLTAPAHESSETSSRDHRDADHPPQAERLQSLLAPNAPPRAA